MAAGPEDLERWIEAFRGPLVGLCASWGSGWREAEEMAADVLAEAWMGRGRFQGNPSDLQALGAWLRGIAFHTWRTRRRREEARREESLGDREPRAVEVDERRDDGQEALAAAFARLSTPHQTVLRMYYLEETSAREVGALLGISHKAVESRLYQARKALRELAERERRVRARGATT